MPSAENFTQSAKLMLILKQIQISNVCWVVPALSRFGPVLFQPGSFRPILMGRFGLIFLSPPRLRIIGRTIIWLFDEESSDVKDLF